MLLLLHLCSIYLIVPQEHAFTLYITKQWQNFRCIPLERVWKQCDEKIDTQNARHPEKCSTEQICHYWIDEIHLIKSIIINQSYPKYSEKHLGYSCHIWYKACMQENVRDKDYVSDNGDNNYLCHVWLFTWAYVLWSLPTNIVFNSKVEAADTATISGGWVIGIIWETFCSNKRN